MIGREVWLVSRPRGWPTVHDFRIVVGSVAAPAPGEVLIRNIVMSVDPYMRNRMNGIQGAASWYLPPFQTDTALEGVAVGEVIESNCPDLAPGDVVLHWLGWREYAVVDAQQATKVDPAAAPTLSAHLGALGPTGLTAYVGVVDVAAVRPGDTVFVSAAAGATGSMAGQIAKQLGAARVVGSAGSAEKVSYVKSLGFHEAFDYRSGPVDKLLRDAAPDGIDVYFDNVGGEQLEAAIDQLNIQGRVTMCGAMSQYNLVAPAPGPHNLSLAIAKRLTLRGFLVTDHLDRMPAFQEDLARWLDQGAIQYDETVVDGIENAPEAFLALMRGANTGKMIVRL